VATGWTGRRGRGRYGPHSHRYHTTIRIHARHDDFRAARVVLIKELRLSGGASAASFTYRKSSPELRAVISDVIDNRSVGVGSHAIATAASLARMGNK